jgi:transcriptional regulator with XRE-family HTH domain/tetratricopeptide (TPR) repeat protein
MPGQTGDTDRQEPLTGGKTFAGELRRARHAAGLTLEELAHVSGVSARALSDMERSRAVGPQRRTVMLIAEALKLDVGRTAEFAAMAKSGRARLLTSATGLCELPGSVADFTGRAAELAWISQFAQNLPAAPRVGLISGGAGLGKTTLVVRAAQHLRDRFPGGILFVDALGMSQRPVAGEEILARLLRATGMRDPQMPQDQSERASRYRQLLTEQRTLVVIDDVTSETQVRALIPGAGDSCLLLTGRRLLSGLEGVRRLHLDPMPSADALDLLGRIVAERGDLQHSHDLPTLADLLGGLPLALRIAGNRLLSRPHWSPADLIARLATEERRLDQLNAGDLKIAAAFGLSYEQLPELTRQVFRRAALTLSPDFSAALAATASDVTQDVALDHLDDLIDLGMVETAPGGRYRMHDLVRLYAHQRLDLDDGPGKTAASRHRVISWLLDTVTAASRWFEPNLSGGTSSAFGSAEEADSWIRTEAGQWFPALGDAAAAGDHHAVITAASPLHWFADRWVQWPGWTDLFLLAAQSAVTLNDASREAEFLIAVAWTFTYPGRDFRPGLPYAQQAVTLTQAIGDVAQEGRAWLVTARIRNMLHDGPGALDAIRLATKRIEQAADADSFCHALIGRGDIALRLGETDEAVASLQRAIELVQNPTSGMTPSIAEATRTQKPRPLRSWRRGIHRPTPPVAPRDFHQGQPASSGLPGR